MAQKLDPRIMMDILRGNPIKKEDLFAAVRTPVPVSKSLIQKLNPE